MKVAFFASLRDGRPSGFQPFRPDGRYVGHADDPEDPEALVDVLECGTFDEAKRHTYELAGWDPLSGLEAPWGDDPWEVRDPRLRPVLVSPRAYGGAPADSRQVFCGCCGYVPRPHGCPGPMF